MAGRTPHRTPLRRVSQGSLFALSRSQHPHAEAPHGLGFLEPAISELADEMESVQVNTQGLAELSASLQSFNDSFASLLHVMRMNALTTDWNQAPTDASHHLYERRTHQAAHDALEKLKDAAALEAEKTAATSAYFAEDNTTFAAGNTTTVTSGGGKVGGTKKTSKAKMSVKEKKDHSILIEKITTTLPLEFRGGDPSLRRHLEIIVDKFILGKESGYKLHDFIIPPDLNQARVNKCLIALVNRKLVAKDSTSGTVMYRWLGLSS